MSAPPRTRFLLPFTTHVLNPVTRRVAGRLPGFAVVIHVGGTSGREYRTPVNVFRHGRDYVFALTYGPDVQWVKNVLAAGGCDLRVSGRTIKLTDPRKLNDPSRALVPLPVRLFLGFMRVDEFLTMRPVHDRSRES